MDDINFHMKKSEFDSRFAERMKKNYPIGTRILLIHMDDPYSPVPDNTKGTVQFVDDIGDIHCVFDNHCPDSVYRNNR